MIGEVDPQPYKDLVSHFGTHYLAGLQVPKNLHLKTIVFYILFINMDIGSPSTTEVGAYSGAIES